jgi:hypothetical protein
MKNTLYNFFALVGFITTFIIACSASTEIDDFDDMDDQSSGTTNVDVSLENDYGKYAIATAQSGGDSQLFKLIVTNTETGVTKVYRTPNGMDNWEEVTGLATTFTH